MGLFAIDKYVSVSINVSFSEYPLPMWIECNWHSGMMDASQQRFIVIIRFLQHNVSFNIFSKFNKNRNLFRRLRSSAMQYPWPFAWNFKLMVERCKRANDSNALARPTCNLQNAKMHFRHPNCWTRKLQSRKYIVFIQIRRPPLGSCLSDGPNILVSGRNLKLNDNLLQSTVFRLVRLTTTNRNRFKLCMCAVASKSHTSVGGLNATSVPYLVYCVAHGIAYGVTM